MSPEGLRFAPEDEPENSTETKSKRRKRRHLRVVPLAEVNEATEEKKTKAPAPIIEAILKPAKPVAEEKAAPTVKPKPELLAEEIKTGQAGEETAETVAEQDAKPSAEADAETAETEEDVTETEGYETLYQELSSVDLSKGEVVIHLNGNEPRSERVKPLRAEAPTQATPEEPEQPESNIPFVATTTFAPERTQEVIPPAAGGGSGGGGGEVPPTPPIGGEAAPFPSEEPEPTAVTTGTNEQVRAVPEYTYSSGEDAGSSYESKDRKVATQKELEDARYYAEKSGLNRGVTTGLLAGGMYEHFKHKRRNKKMEKRLEAKDKELKKVYQERYFEKQQHEAKKREFERQYNVLEKRFENSAVPEKLTKRNTEIKPQNQEAEQLKVPDDHRLETSAWHTIEVDSKTGKAVENPTFQYGHEYYRERAQEAPPVAQRNAAAGEIALVAAAQAGQGSNASASPSSSTVPNIPSASMQGAPKAARSTGTPKSSSTSSSPKTPANSGPIWPWLVALVVIIVLLAVLIR